ncbi:LOW QUALITY PROTEIN: putative pentatricopeptide repeat-containing protein At5g52630 [Dioscorea cayenensis subsp. rotundata]|uniref:LOW QUALITY PROTEIN: putative pentatricopeptide repeat-containing protein At5g52630 n=1 Tax=Dioscorea cayennensis subsp. rotundata TaxID=55577 RepID=A0AB40BRG7_DIOCR|nr:LOW QUALITY PROTEIN: putative pentatricopeptide repeat-containing protein At5g52630 [Dioscorea cayenensis subsp. rotundata]
MRTTVLSRAISQTQATQIHAYLTTTNQLQNPLLHTQLINIYARCDLFSQAILVFKSINEHSNIITWTSLITHLSHNHQPLHAIQLLIKLFGSEFSLRPNHFTLSAVFPACAQTGSVAHGEQVHTLARKLGLECDVFVASSLLDMYAKCGDMDSSRKVFDEMPLRNLVSWNSLIVGFTRNKSCDMAMETFKEMHAECSSVCFGEVNVSSVLSACAGGGLSFGRGVHGSVVKVGMESLVYVNNSLIDMYGKCGCFQYAVEVFDRMRERDVVTWNVLMMGLVHSDRMEEACKYFWAMRRDGIVPDEASFSAALHACANMAAWCYGAAVHNQIIKAGFESNQCVASSLITMYAKCGCLIDAHRVFEESREYVNVVSWTAIIAAFQQHGQGDIVIRLFDEMLERGIKPDYVTYVCVLSACSHNGLIEQGFKYFDSMSRVHGMAPGNEHYACMVDMLGRAGRLDEAKQFIDRMPVKPDVSVWGALLGACRNCRDLEMGREVAQRLFEIEPDNPGNYVLLANMYALHGRSEEAKGVRRLMKIKGVRKETGCSWIDIKNKSIVFTAHDRSHDQTKEIYKMLAKLQELVKQKGYIADTRYAVNDVGDKYKEQGLWYHSERLALAFGLISLPENAPIRIKKNLRTCGDCHAVMKLVSGIVQREIVLRDTNRFHHFFDGSCSCRDYW